MPFFALGKIEKKKNLSSKVKIPGEGRGGEGGEGVVFEALS